MGLLSAMYEDGADFTNSFRALGRVSSQPAADDVNGAAASLLKVSSSTAADHEYPFSSCSLGSWRIRWHSCIGHVATSVRSQPAKEGGGGDTVLSPTCKVTTHRSLVLVCRQISHLVWSGCALGWKAPQASVSMHVPQPQHGKHGDSRISRMNCRHVTSTGWLSDWEAVPNRFAL